MTTRNDVIEARNAAAAARQKAERIEDTLQKEIESADTHYADIMNRLKVADPDEYAKFNADLRSFRRKFDHWYRRTFPDGVPI